MPHSKSMKSEDSWETCHCGALFPSEKFLNHEEQCSGIVAEVNLKELKVGFILNETFHATVRSFNRDLNEKFPGKYKPFVLLHPSTMKILKCNRATYVILKTSNQESIHRTFPSASVDISSIAFPDMDSFKCDCGDMVALQRFYGPADTAKNIFISTKIQKPFVTSEKFKKEVLRRYGGFYVKKGTELRFSYLGYPCSLTITGINGFFQHARRQCNLNDPVISAMSHLSVKDEHPHSEHEGAPNCDSSMSTVENKCVTVPKEVDTDKTYQFFEVTGNAHVVIEAYESVNKQEGYLFSKLGGLDQQIREIKEVVSTFLNLHENMMHGKLPRGILMTGPTGTGKTYIAKAIANEFRINFISISRADINDKYGRNVEILKSKFAEAFNRAPSVIFLDNVEALCPKDNQFVSSTEKAIVYALTDLLDDLKSARYREVLILAATNRPEDVNHLLMLYGRFDKEIKFDVPDVNARFQILKKILQDVKLDLTESQLHEIAVRAPGYTAADFLAVYNKAIMEEYPRQSEDDKEANMASLDTKMFENMIATLKVVKPSVMREFQIEVPQVRWKDIGGMHKVKQGIMEVVTWPLKRSDDFRKLGIPPKRGVLLFGPPGCSKTMIARAVATESDLNFISVKGPELFNKYVGESEKAVSRIFSKARSSTPCVIFFDEIDSLTKSRDRSGGISNVQQRVLAQFLTELDGIDVMKGVSVIAATNCPELIDKALLRPGRFDRLVYVPLPDSSSRKEIFNLQLKVPISEDVQVEKLVQLTEGYSGAEIVAVCNAAKMIAVTEDIRAKRTSFLTALHFEKALTDTPPRIPKDRIKFYERYLLSNLHLSV